MPAGSDGRSAGVAGLWEGAVVARTLPSSHCQPSFFLGILQLILLSYTATVVRPTQKCDHFSVTPVRLMRFRRMDHQSETIGRTLEVRF